MKNETIKEVLAVMGFVFGFVLLLFPEIPQLTTNAIVGIVFVFTCSYIFSNK